MFDSFKNIGNQVSGFFNPPKVGPPVAPVSNLPQPSAPQDVQAVPPQETLKIQKLASGSSVKEVKFQTGKVGSDDPELRFAELKQQGQMDQAAKMLGQFFSDPSPVQRAKFSQLLQKSDDKIVLEFLKQQGFIQNSGVFPFDLTKLEGLKAAEVESLVNKLTDLKNPLKHHQEAINALHTKGIQLPDAQEQGAYLRKILKSGKNAVSVLEQMSHQVKLSPRYTPRIEQAIAKIAGQLKDDDLKDFLKAIGYYSAGVEGYGETRPQALQHLSKQTLQVFHANLDEGDWGALLKYLNFNQLDLVNDLEDLIQDRK